MGTRSAPRPPSATHSLAATPPPRAPQRIEAVAECAAAACVLCACCPLMLLWRCVKTPFSVAWRAARGACCRCGDRRGAIAAYSSFSDIELDDAGRRLKR
ncbi:hypothetical protein Cni_G01700 [Canna indica]|uniref:Uncharacterized protein n=1 Tax=Canna indica TaxID=4628 RepID=A0AAQ3PZ21_9LILI|nr:hypothetical protein Cni_G01700 [Canna indica]